MGNKQSPKKDHDEHHNDPNKSPDHVPYEQNMLATYVANPEVQKQFSTTGKLPFFDPNDPNLSQKNLGASNGHLSDHPGSLPLHDDDFHTLSELASVPKLQAQNKRLENQLEMLKAHVNDYLQKQKEAEEAKKHPQPASPVHNNHEDGRTKEIKSELARVYREIENIKKELQIIQVQSGNTKAINQFEGTENKLSEKKVEVKCLELEKKTLEKTLKEKSKLLRELHEVHDNPFVKSSEDPSVADEFKAIKQQVREGIKHEQMLEKEAQNRNQHIMKLLGELSRKKENYKLILGKTGYDPIDGKVKLVAHSKSPQPRSSQGYGSPGRPFGRPMLNKKPNDSERIDMTEPNFESLKGEFAALQNEEARKQKAFKAKAGQLKDNMAEVDKDKQELTKALIEKDKEAVILRNKAREIYRVLLQHNLLEPGNNYEALFNDKAKSQSPKPPVKKNKPIIINRSVSLTLKHDVENGLANESWAGHENKNAINLKPITSPHASPDLLNKGAKSEQKANFFMTDAPSSPSSPSAMKNNFTKSATEVKKSPTNKLKKSGSKLAYKGFRMDEIGKTAEKDSIGDFNDKDEIGDRNMVRIAAVRVWYSNDGIAGLQLKYRDTRGKIIDGEEHVVNREKCLITELNLGFGDFLHQVTGFVDNSKNVIESLDLVSKNGERISAGKKKAKSTPFKLDINDLEYPSLFHGSLREGGKGKPSVLCKLGVFIRSEEIEEELPSPKNSKQK